jgi:hypothetical protein
LQGLSPQVRVDKARTFGEQSAIPCSFLQRRNDSFLEFKG